MHDPMTVAFDIKSPFRGKPSQFWPEGYRNTVITIWHVDPEKGGSDDSCGWFKRASHGDAAVLEQIRRAFDSEWTGEHLGWFHESGYPKQSVQATTLALFRRAAYIYFKSDWRKTEAFLQRNLMDIIWFAENNTDSLYEAITLKYGPSPRDERVEQFAAILYGWILRAEQPWYRHPRWHVWHWQIQVHPLQHFKRWAFSRCCKCGKGFAYGYAPCSGSWSGTGPLWLRSEKHIYHADCDQPTSNNAASATQEVGS